MRGLMMFPPLHLMFLLPIHVCMYICRGQHRQIMSVIAQDKICVVWACGAKNKNSGLLQHSYKNAASTLLHTLILHPRKKFDLSAFVAALPSPTSCDCFISDKKL